MHRSLFASDIEVKKDDSLLEKKKSVFWKELNFLQGNVTQLLFDTLEVENTWYIFSGAGKICMPWSLKYVGIEITEKNFCQKLVVQINLHQIPCR